MLIGYARVSTLDQSLDLQLDALKQAGCGKIYNEKVSGVKVERDALKSCLEHLREDDTLVVWKLDRLGRSLRELIELTNMLSEKGVNFKSLQEGFDTSTAGGKLIFHVFGALAEFERSVIQERTKAGLAAARSRGRKGGRPAVLHDDMLSKIRSLSKDKDISINDICKMLNIGRSTYYKGLNKLKTG